MLHKLRERIQDEKGFTLIELLVVILIIGILAAIALPAFLNQREKAQDAEAKSSARTVQTALETYYTDHQSYSGVDATKLIAIEPAIDNFDDRLAFVGSPSATGYEFTLESKGSTKTKFDIKNAAGVVTRTCPDASKGKGGCPDDGNW
jgi:type IV pilus assembly protein PilA